MTLSPAEQSQQTRTITFKLLPHQSRPAWEVALLFPAQGYWSQAEYLRLTDTTNQLVEYSAGYIEVLPMPTQKHQDILAYLFSLLQTLMVAINGKAYFAPLRLFIAPDRYREPDILLMLDKNDPRRNEQFWLGADLVIEIVSPDAPERDWVQKRNDYALALIPEYWIVDPLQQCIAILCLDGNSYLEYGRFERGQIAQSVLLADFAVDVSAALDAQ